MADPIGALIPPRLIGSAKAGPGDPLIVDPALFKPLPERIAALPRLEAHYDLRPVVSERRLA